MSWIFNKHTQAVSELILNDSRIKTLMRVLKIGGLVCNPPSIYTDGDNRIGFNIFVHNMGYMDIKSKDEFNLDESTITPFIKLIEERLYKVVIDWLPEILDKIILRIGERGEGKNEQE